MAPVVVGRILTRPQAITLVLAAVVARLSVRSMQLQLLTTVRLGVEVVEAAAEALLAEVTGKAGYLAAEVEAAAEAKVIPAEAGAAVVQAPMEPRGTAVPAPRVATAVPAVGVVEVTLQVLPKAALEATAVLLGRPEALEVLERF